MNYETLLQTSGVLLIIISAAFANVPVIGWVKNKLGIKGEAARVVALCVSVMMGLVVMLAGGQLAPEMVDSPEEITAVIAAIAALAEWYYKAGYKPQS